MAEKSFHLPSSRKGIVAGRPSWETEFCAFFMTRQRAFTRTAYAILGSWHAAEDAAQQTMSSLYVYWPRIRTGNVDVYARRVLVNNCMDAFKRQSRHSWVCDRRTTSEIVSPA